MDTTHLGPGVYSVVDNSTSEGERRKTLSTTFYQETSTMPPEEESDPYGFIFWLSVSLSQIVAVGCVILAAYWGTLYGGFVASDDNLMFNFHPLFMIIGLVFFYGDAIIIYRVLRFFPKSVLKLMHGGLHFSAIVFSSLALVAVFENHRRTNKADLYSLHSWVGIAAFGFFCLQYIGSFVTFLYPGLPPNWRAKVMPFHTFLGVGIFIMVIVAAGMGITEKLLWTEEYATGKSIPKGLVGNSLGILIMVFAFLIVYITTHTSYKRKPIPSEVSSSIIN